MNGRWFLVKSWVGAACACKPASAWDVVRLVILACSLVIVTLPGAVLGASPSFDCSQAASWSEIQLCGDDELAALDRQMVQLYGEARARATSGAKQKLVDDQRAWLRQREGCKTATDPSSCLRQAYDSRISELNATEHSQVGKNPERVVSGTGEPAKATPQPVAGPPPGSEACKQTFHEIPIGGQACGIKLTADRRVFAGGEEIPNAFSSDQEAPAEVLKVIVLPTSPSGRYTVVNPCSYTCQRLFVVDHVNGAIQGFDATLYGPTHWIAWTEDEQYWLSYVWCGQGVRYVRSTGTGASWVRANCLWICGRVLRTGPSPAGRVDNPWTAPEAYYSVG